MDLFSQIGEEVLKVSKGGMKISWLTRRTKRSILHSIIHVTIFHSILVLSLLIHLTGEMSHFSMEDQTRRPRPKLNIPTQLWYQADPVKPESAVDVDGHYLYVYTPNLLGQRAARRLHLFAS